jgi:hypothetical protein
MSGPGMSGLPPPLFYALLYPGTDSRLLLNIPLFLIKIGLRPFDTTSTTWSMLALVATDMSISEEPTIHTLTFLTI